MKFKFSILNILLIWNIVCFSQDISVRSFKLLDTDLTANTTGTYEKDQNGETAALIKIVTTETGFSFDCGMLGIVKTKQTPGEIWLYLPRGAQKITIKHPQLGVLRNYYFPISIEGARTYEMDLVTAKVQTVVKRDAGGQYLIMHVEPATAICYIDDIETIPQNGVVSKFLSYGNHTYSITQAMYKSEKGTFDIGKDKKEITVKLKPDYGILEISTIPENGALVFMDDDLTPLGTTPFTTKPLKKGQHHFRFLLKDYESKVVDYTVHNDGSTQSFVQELYSASSEIKCILPEGCSLYINGELRGKGSWTGRLSEGLYHIEARKEGHISSSQSITVKKNEPQTITLTAPIPVYGIININCTPIGATVYLDEKNVGSSPCVLNDVLVGRHQIVIDMEGYAKYEKYINVEENKITDISETLEKNSKIEFHDGIAKNICLKNWDFNRDGEFTIEEAHMVKSLDGAFKKNDLLMNLDFLKYFTSITELDRSEFYNCQILKTIVLPKSLKRIHGEAFLKCYNLSNLEIPNSIVYVGAGAFRDCSKLNGTFKIGDETYDFSDTKGYLRPENSTDNFKYAINCGVQNLKIKAERQGADLTLYFSFETSFSYCINPELFIQPINGDSKYVVKEANGVSFKPKYTTCNGFANFNIKFSGVPEDITEINLFEPDEEGWKIYGIKI